MVTESAPGWNSQTGRLHDMASSLATLNARIARLAIALGSPLDNAAEVAKVISRPAPGVVSTERRAASDRRGSARAGSSVERRTAHQWDELRGLLVLRYQVEAHFVDEVGVVATREILVQVEAHLERVGFKPGADGIDLKHLLQDD